MDQTPLHFSYHSSKTLEMCGAKMIQVCKTGKGTKRATWAFTITSAGNFLTLMIIFKGTPCWHITPTELPNVDPTSNYTCQEAARMDGRCMLIRVKQILGFSHHPF
jgi:hypothetical protein